MKETETDRQGNRDKHTEVKIDINTARHRETETDRHREIERERERERERESDRQTNKQTDGQAGRQTEIKTDRQKLLLSLSHLSLSLLISLSLSLSLPASPSLSLNVLHKTKNSLWQPSEPGPHAANDIHRREKKRSACLLACLFNLQATWKARLRNISRDCQCYYTETDTADRVCYRTKSTPIDTGSTSPRTDPATPSRLASRVLALRSQEQEERAWRSSGRGLCNVMACGALIADIQCVGRKMFD